MGRCQNFAWPQCRRSVGQTQTGYSGGNARPINYRNTTPPNARRGHPQTDVEGRAFAWDGIGPDLAVHPLHRLAHQGEADARALVTPGMQAIEDLEDLVAIRWVEADAVVANLDDVAAGFGARFDDDA